MVTKVKRASALNPVAIFREHMALKKEAATITTRVEKLKKDLKEWLPTARGTYTNDQGSVFYDFDETVEIGGDSFSGMELRRSVSVKFEEDEATKILKRKGVYEKALSTYVDQDKVMRLLQEGDLTEKDVDKMFSEKESFAFWPVKGEVL